MAEDLRYMQREAARRVRQTREHNRQIFEQYGGHPAADPSAPAGMIPPPLYQPSTPPAPPLYARPPAPTPPPGQAAAPTSALDTEQWLLLGLALLLFRSGCRAELVVALLYLAL